MCLEATTSVVNLIAIMQGQRDPTDHPKCREMAHPELTPECLLTRMGPSVGMTKVGAIRP
jgi:hypothetical protein